MADKRQPNTVYLSGEDLRDLENGWVALVAMTDRDGREIEVNVLAMADPEGE